LNTTYLSDLIHVTNILTLNAGGGFQFEQAGTNATFVPVGTMAMFQLDQPANSLNPGQSGGTAYANLTWLGQPLGFNATLAPLAGNANILAVTVAFTPTSGYWTANSTSSGVWSATGNNSNWFGSTVPNSAGAPAIFPAIQSGPYTVTVTTPITVGNITLSGANTYTLASSGSSLTLNNSGASAVVTAQGGTQVVSAPLILAAAAGMSANVAVGAQLNLLGNISDGASVHGNVSVNGGGTVELFGTNTYTGTTTLNAGTTIISSASSLGTGGNIVFNNSTLQWSPSFTTGDVSMNNSISRNIGIVGNAIFNVPTGLTATLAGNLGDGSTANVTKTGGGDLVLSGNNASSTTGYIGTTIINQGLITFSQLANFGLGIGFAGNIDINGGGLQWAANTSTDISQFNNFIDVGGATYDTNGNTVTLSNAIGGGGTGSLTKVGDGVLALAMSSDAQSFTGNIIINGGTTTGTGAEAR
jgi:autotransporter-associated beta strand protein